MNFQDMLLTKPTDLSRLSRESFGRIGKNAVASFISGRRRPLQTEDQYIAPEAYDAHYSVASDLFAVPGCEFRNQKPTAQKGESG